MNLGYKIIGLFPMVVFDFCENKRFFSKKLESLLFAYFKFYFNKIKLELTKSNGKPRIYILVNSFPIWEASIGSHLRVSLNTSKIYYDQGYEVTYILSNHPYMSKYANKGVIFKSNFRIDKDKFEKKVKLDIYNISGIKNIKIKVLTNYEDKFSVQKYCTHALEYFKSLKLSSQDVFFYVGGKPKSNLFNNLLCNLDVKKVYLTGGKSEKINNIDNFTDFLTAKNPTNIDTEIYCCYVNKHYLLEPFYLETIGDVSLREEEMNMIKQLKYSHITKLLVYVKQNAASSIDLEFSNIINKNLNDKSTGVLVIGDSKENINNKLNKYDNKVFTLSFCDYLYTLFKQLNAQFTTVLIMPKINGNGGTIMIAGLSGMPVVLFTENDSEDTYIPKKYCVANLDKYDENLNLFLNDDNAREKFVKDMEVFKEAKKEEAKKLYLGFLEK